MGKLIPRKLEFTVVGMQHRVTMSTRRMMIDHLPFHVRIDREPDNVHDENAIRVIVDDADIPYNGIHLGYLPRIVAAVISPAMVERRMRITDAWITDLKPEDGTGEMLLSFKASKKFQIDP
jgi:hypothetical protein